MKRGQAAIVSAGHGMDHVECLCPSDLADDDPLRPLAQCCPLKQVLHGDAAGALDVRVAFFEAEELGAQLVQPQLGLGLEYAGPFALRDHQRKYPRQRRLAGASWAAEDDVQARPHRGLEERDRPSRDRSGPDQVAKAEESTQLLLPDGDDERLCNRRKHGIETAAVAHGDRDNRA